MRLFKILIMVSPFLFLMGSFDSHQIYTAAGKKADFSDIIKNASEVDVILFGELHDNPVAHWLQLELTKALFEKHKNKVILGAEMFETDDQLKLNEFLDGKMSDANFEKEAKVWPNYKTDYKPIVSFAKKNGIPFIATNVPRRYAALVSNKNFQALDSLSDEAKKWMAPLPVPFDPELPGYKNMNHSMPGNKIVFLPQAQALKDATMGWFILSNLKKGNIFLHFNGSYHSNNYEGICWYLKKYNPEIKYMTINVVEQEDINAMDKDNAGTADFIIVVDKDMTKTY